MAGETVTRPIFEGIGHVGEIAFYVLATASIVIFGYGVWRRVRKYRRGRSAGRGATIRSALFGHPFAGVRERGDRGSGPQGVPRRFGPCRDLRLSGYMVTLPPPTGAC